MPRLIPNTQLIFNHLFRRFGCCSVLCLVAQSCLTLCDPMDCSLPGSSVHGDSPGKNTGVGCQALLQGIFPTQGSNPGLPNCRWILYHLRCREAPVVALVLIFSHSSHSASLSLSFPIYKMRFRDFPGGPVVRNPPCTAGDGGYSTWGSGKGATESTCINTEPIKAGALSHPRQSASQQKDPACGEDPTCCNWELTQPNT